MQPTSAVEEAASVTLRLGALRWLAIHHAHKSHLQQEDIQPTQIQHRSSESLYMYEYLMTGMLYSTLPQGTSASCRDVPHSSILWSTGMVEYLRRSYIEAYGAPQIYHITMSSFASGLMQHSTEYYDVQ